jgi:type III pantothenate kinase
MSLLLAIDAGNTRVKFGLHDGEAWRATGAIETANVTTLPVAIAATRERAARAIAANVAGPLVEQALREVCENAGWPLTVIASAARQCGVRNGYESPAQLGPDRWAALIAAHALVFGPKIVATAGTALTVDALTAEGDFLGGLIVPGPRLMRRSLDTGTAGLRLTEGAVEAFPASTPDAITSGSIDACVGAVDRVLRRLEARAGTRPALLLSGGAAAELAPHLPRPHSVHEHLVLEGLARIAREG